MVSGRVALHRPHVVAQSTTASVASPPETQPCPMIILVSVGALTCWSKWWACMAVAVRQRSLPYLRWVFHGLDIGLLHAALRQFSSWGNPQLNGHVLQLCGSTEELRRKLWCRVVEAKHDYQGKHICMHLNSLLEEPFSISLGAIHYFIRIIWLFYCWWKQLFCWQHYCGL
jgi:hypothetical protein